MPREDIEDQNISCHRTPAEAAIASLYPIVKPFLPSEGWKGAEYWVQIYIGGRGLSMHFDKDEKLIKEGIMSTPLFSSVLYLSGENTTLQAPTVITNQLYDYEECCPVPEDPTVTTLVFPLRNSYVVFAGNAGHGVLDSTESTGIRVTLLINWWANKPEEIERCPNESLSPVVVENTTEVVPVQKEELEDNNVSGTTPTFPIVVIKESDVAEGDLLMVDDLLERESVDLIKTQGVTFKHEGLSLYPIDNEQLLEMEVTPVVGAAFLLSSIFANDSDSSDSSEE